MFAILISKENLSKIQEHQDSLTTRDAHFNPNVYLAHHRNWYYLRGYVDHKGKFVNWTALPQYILDKDFEYDPDKIKTDWDQIVRQ